MTRTKWNALAVLALAALFLALPSALPASDGDRDVVRLQATLDPTGGDPQAFGEARFEGRSDRRELRVDVEADTEAVGVFVNGFFVGEIALDDQGRGRLELNGRDGDTVPELQDGDEVEVLADDGTLVLSGILDSTR